MFREQSKKILFSIFIISSLISLIIPYYHDYGAYVKQWSIILNNKDPYIGTGNAYGPFYSFFAYLGIYRNISIQRFIFVLSYLLAGYLIWHQSKKIKLDVYVLILLFLNPLFWFFCVKYGSNDSFLAGMTLLGLFFYFKKKYIYSAIFFSLAISFKFIPVFIIPFFIITKRKINFKFSITIFLTIFLIYTIAFLNWGISILEPFRFGSQRASKFFSIFRFIRGDIQPLSFLGINNLDSFSVIFVFTSFVIIFLLYLRYNLDQYITSLLSLSFVILFYKVGHHQFYISLLLISVFVFILNYNYIRYNKIFWYPFILFWGWIFFFTILFDFTYQYNGYSKLKHIIGLPTFVLHFWCNINLIRLNKKKYYINN